MSELDLGKYEALRKSHARLLAALKRTTTDGHYNECIAGQRGRGQCSNVCNTVNDAIKEAEALATEAPRGEDHA